MVEAHVAMVLKAIGEISSVDLGVTWRSDLSSRKVDKVDWKVGPDTISSRYLDRRVRNPSHVPASLAFSLFTRMGSLSISTVSLSPFLPQTQTRTRVFSTRTNLRSFNLKPKRVCTKLRGLGGNQKDSRRFVDENGAVDDMEGYLDHLSLEYDSVWDTKPSWCQPWTIMLTGLSIVACSWTILHSVLVSSLAVGLIGAWWYIFLYSYPKSYSEMIAERRKRVADGYEDIYGKNKSS
ncbi:unnamed protein product [Thlaspi arvense]|uniref:DUF6737 domain-containing protein n=1 Tax=Thlaspi arvense TaxID=13288 RepID=A0AAU9SSC7_THLAR|nr:unnamed protein product [Thlaspi arvense]